MGLGERGGAVLKAVLCRPCFAIRETANLRIDIAQSPSNLLRRHRRCPVGPLPPMVVRCCTGNCRRLSTKPMAIERAHIAP